MIARDSKSYPYLGIAQHYGIDYGEVLTYSDNMRMMFDPEADAKAAHWKWEVYCLEVKRFKHWYTALQLRWKINEKCS